MKGKLMLMLLCIALACAMLVPALGDEAWQVGDAHCGFTVTDVRTFDLIGADTITLKHDRTGALVMLLLNEDTNRAFDITFRTVTENSEGTPHVFEHATLDGSEKYPPRSLFFNLSYQTYNTFMNAATYSMMTTYPIASLSEEQLLLYADYYLDSCFHPIIMTDESIFREEAWRYALTGREEPLTLTGTVYNEMKGASTLPSCAQRNYYRTLAPGSVLGNEFGGDPAFIPDLTWQALKDYHDTYYHPSNSLSFVYGRIDDPDAFLSLLDGVFSTYDAKDVSGLFMDSAYEPLTAEKVAVYPYAVEEGTDTDKGAMIYYGFRIDTQDAAEIDALDLLTAMINADSSAFNQLMKERMPGANASCSIDLSAVPNVIFSASGVNADDADAFRAVVDEAMVTIADEGFTQEEAEAIEASTRLSVLLTPESSNVGVNIVQSIAYYWSACDRLYGYLEYISQLNSFAAYAADGTFCRVARQYIVDNPIRALAVTEPVPGLKESEEAALAQHLAEVKAAMSDEELDAIIAATLAPEKEEEDSSALVAALSAVTVDTLPEEYRTFEIQDETLDHGVRSLYVNAASDGLGKTMLRLDVSSLPMEQLHWLALYIDLLGDFDTASHTQSEVSMLATRYTNDLQIGVITPMEDRADGYTPYLRIFFNALDEDLSAAYDLMAEVLFTSDFSDLEKLSGRISNYRSQLKQKINADNYAVMLYRMFSRGQESYAFYDYMKQLPYYAFLCEVEEAMTVAPEGVQASLESMRDTLRTLGASAVYGYVGTEEGRAANQAAVDAFLSRMTAEEKQRQVYTFEAVAPAEGLILDVNTNFNIAFASWEDLGLEKYTADWDVICALVNDRYLMPELREARGAYGAYIYAIDCGLYAFTYRDPGVAESFDVFSRLGEMLESDAAITQELLNGYILSSYSTYALPKGELTDGYTTMGNLLNGHPQEEKLESMRALKSVTVERIPEYAAALARVMTNGICGTVASASVINANAGLYTVTANPFGSVDASQVTLSDVDEQHPYYAAIRSVFEAGYMTAEDGAFCPERTLTLGEFATPLYVAIGGAPDAAEAIAFLTQYEIIPGEPAETELTREDAVLYCASFCLALGMELEETPLGEYADAADTGEGLEGVWAWMLANELIAPTADGLLAPASPMTRAEYAFMLAQLLQ